METEVVTIQEPVSTKKNVEEAPGGVILDHSSMKVDNEITSHHCGNNTIPGEADVVNGSGKKETAEAEREKGEAMKTISVEEENKIVKEKASETEKDDQSSIFVHEPESFNRNIEDAKIILSDATLEKEKEDDIIEKPEEVSVEKAVIEEDQTDTKHSPEQEEEIGNISKVLVDTTPVKVDENDIEKSLNSAHEEIPIKTDEVNEEKDSSSAETSVNETEAEHKATVSVEEISRNGENIVNETVPEEETATDGESIHDIETTKSVLLEVKKEEEEAEVKTDAEPLIKTVVEEDNIVNNEETTAHESESLKENEEPVEEIKNSDDAEQITSEVTVDKEKEEVITQNTEEEQESVRVIETQTIQEEEIESKASLDHEEEKDKSSKDTEEHEHELVRDKPQGETFVTEAESVDTSTVQEAEILKTNINETEAHSTMGGEEEGQETKENTKTSQDLKEDKEQEETEIVKTIISSDEVRSSDVQVEEFGEHIEPSSLKIKDESHGREESVEVKTKETVQEEITEEKHENLHDVASSESVKSQDNEPETALVTDTESQEKFEETPSDLALNVDKEELKDEKIKEEQRGLDSNGAEEEQVDQNRTDETEESPVAKLVVLPDVEESVEQMQTPSIESASEISEETSKTIDVKIEEKPEEEVTLHQEGQEKGSYGLETKEETVSVPESIELGEKSQEEKSVIDINPLQEESSVPNEQEKETKLETHEPINEEVKADEVIEVSSTLPSKELEGETVVEAEKIENIKDNEEEQAADKIQKSVESHSSLPSSLEEKEHETVSEKIKDEKVEDEPIVQIKSEDNTTKSPERQEDFSESVEETKVVQAEQTRDTEKCSMDQSQPEEQVKEAYSRDEQEKEVSRNSENIVNETYALHSGEAEEEEETATNGESPLHDVETAKRVLVEVEKDAEESEMKTDAEPSLDAIEKEGIETLKTVVEDAKIVNNEETTAYESTSLKGDDHQEENAESVEAIKNSDDAEQNREMEEDITQKTEKIQESSMVIQTPTTQGEEIESETSLELKEEVDQSSKDIEEHDHVLGRDISQCETLEAEAIEPKEDTKPSLDKEDEEQEVTETAKTVIFSDEVRPSDQVDVQVEELSEDIEPRSSEIKDESHGREESVEVKTKEIVQEESTEEKHENRLDVPSTESEKYQDNEPETSLVASTESPEKFEDIPSDLAINVDKEELKDEKINVDQVDGTQIMEEQRDLDPNETKADQIDQKKTDETEESPVIKLVGLPDVESVDQTQTPSPESPSEVPEETSNPIDENIEEKSEEETVAVQESKELGEQAHEERSLIDLNPLQEESSQPNEQEKETKLEKHEPANEEVKSDEVIEVSSASLSKEFLQAEKIENIEDNEEDQAEDKIQKSVETFEAHNSLPSSLEEKEHKTISEKIEDEKVKEEEPIVQIKSEDDTTKSHERPEDFSESVEETMVVQAEQTIDSEPSLTEKCSMDQSHPEEKVKEACSRDEQEKEISKNSEDFENETYASHSAEAAEEEETATNGESPLHDVETTKSVLLKVEKEAEMKTEEIESVKTVVEDAKIVDNEETAAHESKSLQGDTHEEKNAEPVETIKNSDDAEEISSEVTLDREMEEDITQKTEKVQESSMIIGTPTTQGEGIKSKTSLELKEEVDQSSKDTEEHQLVVGRDIPQFETLEIEAVDTSTVQEAAILKTLETNINETEEVHSAIGGAEESQEIKEDTETSMDLKVDKEQKEAETLKTVIFSDEVRPSDQVDAQAEELGEDTELCSSEIKDESQGREESVEVESKETVQDENIEEKNVNLLDVQPEESEKCHENELETTLVSKIESQEKSEEFLLDLTLKDELKDEKTKADQVDETQTMEVLRGLDLNEPEAEQIDQNRNEETEESPVEKLVAVEDSGLDETTHNQTFLDVEPLEKLQKPSLETSSELSEETSKTVYEKIEDKAKEEVTLHQECQEDGSYGLETKEETVSVPNEQETETKLQEKNEPTNEEVSNDQHSLVEETSDEVIQVSSALPPEEREGETVVEAEKIEDKKVDEEEQVADKDLKILATVETVEPHSSLPSSSEEQEHDSVSEKTDDEKVKEAEAMGDMSEKGLEIAETTDVSLPSVDQTKDIKAFDEEIHITSVAVPLDEQEKVTSTEKEETKENETAEVKKGDEEITTITSKTSENVCIQQEEFEKIEAPKLEESQEDKSLEISETIKAVEATSDQTLPIETSDADKTHSSELVSEEKDQTPKQVEEIHEEETKEAYKFQAEEILPTEIIPRESSDQALIYLLASKESEDDVTETKDTQEERSVSVETEESVGETKPKEPEDEHVETPASPIILEKNDNETLIAEAKKGDEDINETETTLALDTSGNSKTSENVCIKEDEFKNLEAPKLEESKEDKSQEILEIAEAIEATGNQTELVSRLDDQTPRHVEEIHEEDAREERKFEAIGDQSIPVETSQAYQTPSSDLASELDDQITKQVEEVHEEDTKEEYKLQVAVDQILPVETSEADQTSSLVSEILGEEIKETHKVQAEDIVPRESFGEAPVSMLASGEPVTPQEGDYDTQEARHVTAETEEKVETSNKLTEVEDENTKKTDIEVAEHEDENSSNLPVVEILKGLHTTLETEREVNDSASSGENLIIEPADQEQKKGDAEVESNEKDSASDIIEELNLQEEYKEEVKVQDDIRREFEVNVEEKLQEETREIAECKEEVPADLSLTEVLPVVKILTPSSPLPSEEQEHVMSEEKQEEHEPQQDVNASTSEKISLQEEQKEKKAETHENVKEEDQIVDIKEEKKNEEEQDEKLLDSAATRDIEEIFSSEVKDDKEVNSVLGREEDINEVVISEKQTTDPVGVITKAREAEHESNEEHVETQVILDDTKNNDDRDFPTEQALKDQEDEVSADKSVTKEAPVEKNQVPSSALLDDQDLSVKKPSEIIQPHQSPNQVEETSFEFKKTEEDKNEETGDALIVKENVQVQDQPKDFEASVTDKETSEQEQKSNDLKKDFGTNVKDEDEVRRDSHDSVVEPKEETGLIEEKKEVEHVKTELEDAIKHGVLIEEKNNTSEKIEHESAKEISQEESKQTYNVKEEIREEEKETKQECFKKTDDATDFTQTETCGIESLSSVSKAKDKSEQKNDIPNQRTREIAVEVPKIAEEVHKKDGESKNKKDLLSKVKESEPTEKESARKSLSNLIQKVKRTTKTEDATKEPHIEEEPKTEEDESEDGDHEHNKDDKTSPDSIVMVEAKDTVSIIKTHKKSQGILSGVGSKVMHSISKVKKVLTGKSSHTTKPSSPK